MCLLRLDNAARCDRKSRRRQASVDSNASLECVLQQNGGHIENILNERIMFAQLILHNVWTEVAKELRRLNKAAFVALFCMKGWWKWSQHTCSEQHGAKCAKHYANCFRSWRCGQSNTASVWGLPCLIPSSAAVEVVVICGFVFSSAVTECRPTSTWLTWPRYKKYPKLRKLRWRYQLWDALVYSSMHNAQLYRLVRLLRRSFHSAFLFTVAICQPLFKEFGLNLRSALVIFAVFVCQQITVDIS